MRQSKHCHYCGVDAVHLPSSHIVGGPDFREREEHSDHAAVAKCRNTASLRSNSDTFSAALTSLGSRDHDDRAFYCDVMITVDIF